MPEPVNVTHHGNGRICQYDADDSEWYIIKAEEADQKVGKVGAICDMDHSKPWGLSPERAINVLKTGKLPGFGGIKPTAAGVVAEFDGFGFPSVEAEEIIVKLIPEFIELFLSKNEKYAKVQEGFDLGVQGEVPDINRKWGVLVDRIWCRNDSPGEKSDEVMLDMIGHLFLMLLKFRHEGDVL